MKAYAARERVAEEAAKAMARANELRARKNRADAELVSFIGEIVLELFPDLPRDPDELVAYLTRLRDAENGVVEAVNDADSADD